MGCFSGAYKCAFTVSYIYPLRIIEYSILFHAMTYAMINTYAISQFPYLTEGM